jgi:putative ABC transport system ATP-binding protein
MTPILSFEGVSKAWASSEEGAEPRYALRDVTCHVAPGRKVAITGRSGSGKSTLLHLAAGIDIPTAGSILLQGHDLAAMAEDARTRARRETIGLVFQFFHLLPHLSVRENVLLPAWIAGGDPSVAEARADELLHKVDLADRSGDPVAKLSGGEQQRVAICRALLRRPKLLLADEPTGNLDDETGTQVMDLLLRLVAEEGSTLVYVTHDAEQAALADESWQLHSGKLEVG